MSKRGAQDVVANDDPFELGVVDADEDEDGAGEEEMDEEEIGEEQGEEGEDEDEADAEEGGDGEEGEEEADAEVDSDEELDWHREDGEEDQDDDDLDSEDEEDEESEEGEEEGEEDEEEEAPAPKAPAAISKASSKSSSKASSRAAGAASSGTVKPEAAPSNGLAAAASALTAAQADEEHGEESDSEDEAPVNTIGNVPLHWYDDFDHVGYDIDGNKIMRGTQKDELDALIARFDDPNASRTIFDALHGRDVVLSDEDVALIRRLQRRRYPDANVDPFPDTIEFEYKDSIHPLSQATPAKASFVPSKWEAKKVMRLVMAMRSEQYQKSVTNRLRQEEKRKPNYEYNLWDEPLDGVRQRKILPPPKMALPGNAESYNPPPEYLLSAEERAAWEKMDPSDRPLNFVPQRYSALRRVPLYEPLIKERFERCLDLYLCPREARTKLNIDPDSLIPQLPKPAELRPFPEQLSQRYRGHNARVNSQVNSLSVSSSGQWLLSAGADGTVRLWEVSSGRCARVWPMGAEVRCVAFNPSDALDLAAATVGNRRLADRNKVVLFMAGTAEGERREASEALLAAAAPGGGSVAWGRPSGALQAAGVAWEVSHAKSASLAVWHHKGDYLASVAPEGASRAVLLHQTSKRTSGSPFTKSKGRIETVAFHPSKPLFFVATQRHVRVYDLLKQELLKKLNPSVKWISSLSIHPGGDNLILGSYDKKLCWFDTDLSTSPYKTLRAHQLAVRSVAYHPTLPLFASASDDTAVHVYHGRVFDDLMQNALIVPVKILRGHKPKAHVGVMACVFHPTRPWLFSAGADGDIVLWTAL